MYISENCDLTLRLRNQFIERHEPVGALLVAMVHMIALSRFVVVAHQALAGATASRQHMPDIIHAVTSPLCGPVEQR